MLIGLYSDVSFEVSSSRTYLIEALSRKGGADYEEHKVAGGKARLEFVAPALTTVELDIRLMAALGVPPRNAVWRLRQICEKGEVHRLIIGDVSFGKFVITDVSDDWNRSSPLGVPVDISAHVSFKEYL